MHSLTPVALKAARDLVEYVKIRKTELVYSRTFGHVLPDQVVMSYQTRVNVVSYQTSVNVMSYQTSVNVIKCGHLGHLKTEGI